MRVYLNKGLFTDKEFTLVENGSMRAVAFKYSTGVEALRVENEKGYFIILPFQGQQIWRAIFCGRELVMRTKFDEPVANVEYLKTYGGFLLHCGINNTGKPQEGEKPYPQHGEIPNAEYKTAYIDCEDDYISVGGELRYDMAFVKSYTFSPECRLYKDDTVLKIFVTLENRRQSPMDYMYLCHINFRPIDGAKLIYSADYQKVRAVRYIPDDIPNEQKTRLTEYFDALEKNPAVHNEVGGDGQIYNPEICFLLDYKSDENNRAYTLQYTDDGACYVSHDANILPVGVRWISRTGDEDSMGMILPSTAEHLGYRNAQEKGQIKFLGPMEKISFYTEAGWVDKEKADRVKEQIEAMNK
ncbi:MAG: DUF4432 family protein [Clostridia bacterium]|nr:DUF4432 family protein [Clostridia bacterium]MBP3359594.1 DUF4432 family protein [Clostridia bacterium]